MILWFKDRGVFSGNIPPPKEWERIQDEADVIIEFNVVIKNRFGRVKIGITNVAISDLRMMSLASQLAFFQSL